MPPSHIGIDSRLTANTSANEQGSPNRPSRRSRENNAQGNAEHERDIDMKTATGWVVALMLCALLGMGALGCNTFKGMGKDIEKGGEGIQNAAENTQHRHGHHQSQPYTITASAESGGSISPSGSTRISYGSRQTFTITASTGYHVADVLVDGKSEGARTRYAFDNVTDNHTISALFTANPK